ncbi:hypothetical protein J7L49_05980 [Candidatus Bathyarchaeota archaeon]|nr:hypothetical protein [Candidatus Bathyarchaeota archaeon]
MKFSYIEKYKTLTDILADHKLASLGDSFVNFTYSLALSEMKGEPFGIKVKGQVLANALKKAGLREYLPSRMSRHTLADAAEALIVYAWLADLVSLDETISVLRKAENSVDAFTRLLLLIRRRVRF